MAQYLRLKQVFSEFLYPILVLVILKLKSLEVDDPPLPYFAQLLLVLFEVLFDLVFLFIESL